MANLRTKIAEVLETLDNAYFDGNAYDLEWLAEEWVHVHAELEGVDLTKLGKLCADFLEGRAIPNTEASKWLFTELLNALVFGCKRVTKLSTLRELHFNGFVWMDYIYEIPYFEMIASTDHADWVCDVDYYNRAIEYHELTLDCEYDVNNDNLPFCDNQVALLRDFGFKITDVA